MKSTSCYYSTVCCICFDKLTFQCSLHSQCSYYHWWSLHSCFSRIFAASHFLYKHCSTLDSTVAAHPTFAPTGRQFLCQDQRLAWLRRDSPQQVELCQGKINDHPGFRVERINLANCLMTQAFTLSALPQNWGAEGSGYVSV